MNQNQLAKALSVSRQAINQAIKDGRLIPGPDGSFAIDDARRQMTENRQAQRPQGPIASLANNLAAAIQDQEKKEPESVMSGKPTSVHDAFNRAKAFREQCLAKRAELDLKERSKQLVDRDEVAQAWADMVSATRSQLLLLPARLATKTAPISDVRELQVLIDKEIRTVLTTLSEYQAA